MPMRSNRGQAIVETALVIPVLFAFALVFVYFFLMGRQLLKFQSAATDLAQLASTSSDTGALRIRQTALLPQTMEGRATPPLARRDTALLPSWQATRGYMVTREPGRLVTLHVDQLVLPFRFMRWFFFPIHMKWVAVLPVEPAVPREE